MERSDSNILTGYLGTYASEKSKGIYRFTMDAVTGQLTVPELYYEALDCKYLSLYKGILAAPFQKEDAAGICLLDVNQAKPQLLAEKFEEATTACFITQDENWIYTANYHEGIVLIYQKDTEGVTLVKRIDIAPKAGCHQVLLHDGLLLIPCLLLDEIRIFDSKNNFCQIGEIPFPKGTGPRHGVFTKDHRFLFIISELSNELYTFEVSETSETAQDANPCFRLLSVQTLFPQNKDNTDAPRSAIPTPAAPISAPISSPTTLTPPTSAAIRFSPDEHYLYISTRYADVISVFAVESGKAVMIQQINSSGIHPRDIILSPDGRFLLAVNRTEGGLVVFPISQEGGTLGPVCSRVPVFEAVSIVLDGPS